MNSNNNNNNNSKALSRAHTTNANDYLKFVIIYGMNGLYVVQQKSKMAASLRL